MSLFKKIKEFRRSVKILFWSALSLFVLVLLALCFINPIAKFSIEKLGPEFIGVPIDVGSLDISLFKGRVELRDLVVHNPAGYDSDHAVRLGYVDVEIVPSSIFSEKLVIHELTLKNINLMYERKLSGSNIEEIMANIKKLSSEKSDSQKKETRMQVDEIELEDVGFSLLLSGIGGKEGLRTAITVKDLGPLGEEGPGITGFDLAMEIFTALFNNMLKDGGSAISTTLERGGNALGEELNSGAKSISNGLKGIFSSEKKSE